VVARSNISPGRALVRGRSTTTTSASFYHPRSRSSPSPSSSSSSSSRYWATIAACVPLAIWARDSLFGFCRVQGSSMEPELENGDLILVRKCELGTVADSLVRAIFGGEDGNAGETTERARLLMYEWAEQSGMGGMGLNAHQHQVPVSRLYECPPLALSGHVVVYKNPRVAFPNELCVKRVIGVSGQYVYRDPTTLNIATREDAGYYLGRRRRRHRRRGDPPGGGVVAVPPYSIFVEGDNRANSQDSRHVGPIGKGLLVGVAEYVVWPPSRWKRIRRSSAPEESRDRAYWPLG